MSKSFKANGNSQKKSTNGSSYSPSTSIVSALKAVESPASSATSSATDTAKFAFSEEEKREIAMIQAEIDRGYLEAGKLDMQIELAKTRKRTIQESVLALNKKLEDRVSLAIKVRGHQVDDQHFGWAINTDTMVAQQFVKQPAAQ